MRGSGEIVYGRLSGGLRPAGAPSRVDTAPRVTLLVDAFGQAAGAGGAPPTWALSAGAAATDLLTVYATGGAAAGARPRAARAARRTPRRAASTAYVVLVLPVLHA